MTPYEHQQLALAKWEGWTMQDGDLKSREAWLATTGETLPDSHYMPDYTSLDILHECVLKLPVDLFSAFEDHLHVILVRDYMAKFGGDFEHLNSVNKLWFLINATAAQRREALLRTLGLWTEEMEESK